MRNRKIVRRYDHVDRHDLEQGESVFHTANGYIGVRGAFEEGYCCDVRSVRGCYINGVYDITSMNQAEPLYGLVDKKQTIVNLAEVQDIRIWADGELVTVCGAYERTADLDWTGVLSLLSMRDSAHLSFPVFSPYAAGSQAAAVMISQS